MAAAAAMAGAAAMAMVAGLGWGLGSGRGLAAAANVAEANASAAAAAAMTAMAAANGLGRVATGRQMEFLFLRTECLANAALDHNRPTSAGRTAKSIGAVRALPAPPACLPSNGLPSATTTTTTATTAMAQQWSSTGEMAALNPDMASFSNFTIEFWLQTRLDTSSSYFPLLTVGNTSVPLYAGCGYDLQVLFGRKNSTTASVFTRMCGVDYSLNSLPIQFHDDITCQPAESSAFPAQYMWSDISRLSFFTYPGAAAIWPGQLFLFAMYNRSLSASEIQQNYQAGIANSDPIVTDLSFTILENGQVGDHSHDPAYFSQPIPSTELTEVLLTGYDFDDSPVSPNYQTAASLRMSIELVTLPPAAMGVVLYFPNGTAITNVPVRLPPNGTHVGGGLLRCRPPLDTYSYNASTPLFSFTFRAVDGQTGALSAIATASVIVTHVYKPPRPQLSLSSSGLANVSMSFTITALTIDRPVAGLRLLTLPAGGPLSWSNGTSIGRPGVLVPYGSVLYFMYTSPTIHPNASLGILAMDAFSYLLVDVDGRESIEATYSFVLSTPLRPTYGINRLVQATCSPIYLGGADLSAPVSTLSMQLARLPLHGSLFWASDCLSQPVSLSSSAAFPSSGMAVVYYRSAADYFNLPLTSFNGSPLPFSSEESLAFRILSRVGLASQTMLVPLPVNNLNSPTSLGFTMPLAWQQSGVTLLAARGINSPSSGSASELVFTGFTLDDPDRDTSLVRVTIRGSSSSSISLRAAAVARLDFSSVHYCYSSSSWECMGSGFSEFYMSFVALPSDVLAALNGMTYRNLQPYSTDNLTIAIYDGAGDNCLRDEVQPVDAVRNGCFMRSLSFTIHVEGLDGSGSNSDLQSTSTLTLSAQLEYVGIGLAAIVIVLLLRAGLHRFHSQPSTKDEGDKVGYDNETPLKSQRTTTATATAATAAIYLESPESIRRQLRDLRPSSHRGLHSPSHNGGSGSNGGGVGRRLFDSPQRPLSASPSPQPASPSRAFPSLFPLAEPPSSTSPTPPHQSHDAHTNTNTNTNTSPPRSPRRRYYKLDEANCV